MPIRIECRATLSLLPEEIAAQILDVEKWSEFQGYGVLPGIAAAVIEQQTDDIVGTRIRVQNRDGSTHVEEIAEWQPESRLRLRFGDFSPPVSWLATHFDELWELERHQDSTLVARTMLLYPRSVLTWPILKLISILLKRALARHLLQLQQSENNGGQI